MNAALTDDAVSHLAYIGSMHHSAIDAQADDRGWPRRSSYDSLNTEMDNDLRALKSSDNGDVAAAMWESRYASTIGYDEARRLARALRKAGLDISRGAWFDKALVDAVVDGVRPSPYRQTPFERFW